MCDICDKDISKHVKIFDPNIKIIYCVPCFCKLQVFPSEYHVINKLNFVLFQTDWTAQDQLLLFDGMKQYGFGNWKDISQLIGTKTSDQVQQHYKRLYLSNSNFIPQQHHGKQKNKKLKYISKDVQRGRRQVSKQQRINKSQRIASQPVKSNAANASDIVGYMPLRGQFQIQYDNDAQLLLAQMQFNDDDTQQQRQTKMKLLQIYNLRIDQRINRKKFVLQRQLLDFKKQSQLDKKRTKQQKQIYNMMKAFARFNTPQDHQKLIDGLIQQKKIRQRIQQLKQYRKLGLKTFAQVQAFVEQRLSNSDLRIKKKQQNDSYIWENKGISSRKTRVATAADNKTQKKVGNVLSAQEQNLCDSLQLSIYHYLIIKQTLVRQSLRQGFIRKDDTDKFFKLDKKKVNRIYDYLLSIKKIQDQKK